MRLWTLDPTNEGFVCAVERALNPSVALVHVIYNAKFDVFVATLNAPTGRILVFTRKGLDVELDFESHPTQPITCSTVHTVRGDLLTGSADLGLQMWALRETPKGATPAEDEYRETGVKGVMIRASRSRGKPKPPTYRIQLRRAFRPMTAAATAAAFDEAPDDGRVFAWAGRELHCWQTDSGTLLWVFNARMERPIVELAYAAGVGRVVGRDVQGGLHVWSGALIRGDVPIRSAPPPLTPELVQMMGVWVTSVPGTVPELVVGSVAGTESGVPAEYAPSLGFMLVPAADFDADAVGFDPRDLVAARESAAAVSPVMQGDASGLAGMPRASTAGLGMFASLRGGLGASSGGDSADDGEDHEPDDPVESVLLVVDRSGGLRVWLLRRASDPPALAVSGNPHALLPPGADGVSVEPALSLLAEVQLPGAVSTSMTVLPSSTGDQRDTPAAISGAACVKFITAGGRRYVLVGGGSRMAVSEVHGRADQSVDILCWPHSLSRLTQLTRSVAPGFHAPAMSPGRVFAGLVTATHNRFQLPHLGSGTSQTANTALYPETEAETVVIMIPAMPPWMANVFAADGTFVTSLPLAVGPPADVDKRAGAPSCLHYAPEIASLCVGWTDGRVDLLDPHSGFRKRCLQEPEGKEGDPVVGIHFWTPASRGQLPTGCGAACQSDGGMRDGNCPVLSCVSAIAHQGGDIVLWQVSEATHKRKRVCSTGRPLISLDMLPPICPDASLGGASLDRVVAVSSHGHLQVWGWPVSRKPVTALRDTSMLAGLADPASFCLLSFITAPMGLTCSVPVGDGTLVMGFSDGSLQRWSIPAPRVDSVGAFAAPGGAPSVLAATAPISGGASHDGPVSSVAVPGTSLRALDRRAKSGSGYFADFVLRRPEFQNQFAAKLGPDNKPLDSLLVSAGMDCSVVVWRLAPVPAEVAAGRVKLSRQSNTGSLTAVFRFRFNLPVPYVGISGGLPMTANSRWQGSIPRGDDGEGEWDIFSIVGHHLCMLELCHELRVVRTRRPYITKSLRDGIVECSGWVESGSIPSLWPPLRSPPHLLSPPLLLGDTLLSATDPDVSLEAATSHLNTAELNVGWPPLVAREVLFEWPVVRPELHLWARLAWSQTPPNWMKSRASHERRQVPQVLALLNALRSASGVSEDVFGDRSPTTMSPVGPSSLRAGSRRSPAVRREQEPSGSVAAERRSPTSMTAPSPTSKRASPWQSAGPSPRDEDMLADDAVDADKVDTAKITSELLREQLDIVKVKPRREGESEDPVPARTEEAHQADDAIATAAEVTPPSETQLQESHRKKSAPLAVWPPRTLLDDVARDARVPPSLGKPTAPLVRPKTTEHVGRHRSRARDRPKSSGVTAAGRGIEAVEVIRKQADELILMHETETAARLKPAASAEDYIKVAEEAVSMALPPQLVRTRTGEADAFADYTTTMNEPGESASSADQTHVGVAAGSLHGWRESETPRGDVAAGSARAAVRSRKQPMSPATRTARLRQEANEGSREDSPTRLGMPHTESFRSARSGGSPPGPSRPQHRGISRLSSVRPQSQESRVSLAPQHPMGTSAAEFGFEAVVTPKSPTPGSRRPIPYGRTVQPTLDEAVELVHETLLNATGATHPRAIEGGSPANGFADGRDTSGSAIPEATRTLIHGYTDRDPVIVLPMTVIQPPGTAESARKIGLGGIWLDPSSSDQSTTPFPRSPYLGARSSTDVAGASKVGDGEGEQCGGRRARRPSVVSFIEHKSEEDESHTFVASLEAADADNDGPAKSPTSPSRSVLSWQTAKQTPLLADEGPLAAHTYTRSQRQVRLALVPDSERMLAQSMSDTRIRPASVQSAWGAVGPLGTSPLPESRGGQGPGQGQGSGAWRFPFHFTSDRGIPALTGQGASVAFPIGFAEQMYRLAQQVAERSAAANGKEAEERLRQIREWQAHHKRVLEKLSRDPGRSPFPVGIVKADDAMLWLRTRNAESVSAEQMSWMIASGLSIGSEQASVSSVHSSLVEDTHENPLLAALMVPWVDMSEEAKTMEIDAALKDGDVLEAARAAEVVIPRPSDRFSTDPERCEIMDRFIDWWATSDPVRKQFLSRELQVATTDATVAENFWRQIEEEDKFQIVMAAISDTTVRKAAIDHGVPLQPVVPAPPAPGDTDAQIEKFREWLTSDAGEAAAIEYVQRTFLGDAIDQGSRLLDGNDDSSDSSEFSETDDEELAVEGLRLSEPGAQPAALARVSARQASRRSVGSSSRSLTQTGSTEDKKQARRPPVVVPHVSAAPKDSPSPAAGRDSEQREPTRAAVDSVDGTDEVEWKVESTRSGDRAAVPGPNSTPDRAARPVATTPGKRAAPSGGEKGAPLKVPGIGPAVVKADTRDSVHDATDRAPLSQSIGRRGDAGAGVSTRSPSGARPHPHTDLYPPGQPSGRGPRDPSGARPDKSRADRDVPERRDSRQASAARRSPSRESDRPREGRPQSAQRQHERKAETPTRDSDTSPRRTGRILTPHGATSATQSVASEDQQSSSRRKQEHRRKKKKKRRDGPQTVPLVKGKQKFNVFKKWYTGREENRVEFLKRRRFGFAIFTMSRIVGRFLAGFRRRQLLKHAFQLEALSDESKRLELAAACLDRMVRKDASADGVTVPGHADGRLLVESKGIPVVKRVMMKRWYAFAEWFTSTDNQRIRIAFMRREALSAARDPKILAKAAEMSIKLEPGDERQEPSEDLIRMRLRRAKTLGFISSLKRAASVKDFDEEEAPADAQAPLAAVAEEEGSPTNTTMTPQQRDDLEERKRQEREHQAKSRWLMFKDFFKRSESLRNDFLKRKIDGALAVVNAFPYSEADDGKQLTDEERATSMRDMAEAATSESSKKALYLTIVNRAQFQRRRVLASDVHIWEAPDGDETRLQSIAEAEAKFHKQNAKNQAVLTKHLMTETLPTAVSFTFPAELLDVDVAKHFEDFPPDIMTEDDKIMRHSQSQWRMYLEWVLMKFEDEESTAYSKQLNKYLSDEVDRMKFIGDVPKRPGDEVPVASGTGLDGADSEEMLTEEEIEARMWKERMSGVINDAARVAKDRERRKAMLKFQQEEEELLIQRAQGIDAEILELRRKALQRAGDVDGLTAEERFELEEMLRRLATWEMRQMAKAERETRQAWAAEEADIAERKKALFAVYQQTAATARVRIRRRETELAGLEREWRLMALEDQLATRFEVEEVERKRLRAEMHKIAFQPFEPYFTDDQDEPVLAEAFARTRRHREVDSPGHVSSSAQASPGRAQTAGSPVRPRGSGPKARRGPVAAPGSAEELLDASLSGSDATPSLFRRGRPPPGVPALDERDWYDVTLSRKFRTMLDLPRDRPTSSHSLRFAHQLSAATAAALGPAQGSLDLLDASVRSGSRGLLARGAQQATDRRAARTAPASGLRTGLVDGKDTVRSSSTAVVQSKVASSSAPTAQHSTGAPESASSSPLDAQDSSVLSTSGRVVGMPERGDPLVSRKGPRISTMDSRSSASKGDFAFSSKRTPTHSRSSSRGRAAAGRSLPKADGSGDMRVATREVRSVKLGAIGVGHASRRKEGEEVLQARPKPYAATPTQAQQRQRLTVSAQGSGSSIAFGASGLSVRAMTPGARTPHRRGATR